MQREREHGSPHKINPPQRIIAVMPCEDKRQAARAEYALKKMERSNKLLWAQSWIWKGSNDHASGSA